jgi:hypothetical protein
MRFGCGAIAEVFSLGREMFLPRARTPSRRRMEDKAVPGCNGDMPRWIPSWCAEHLGRAPVEVLFAANQMSAVIGVRLSDGLRVVVKAREDDGSLAVHAEEYRDDGDIVADDSPEVGARYGAVFARLMTALEEVAIAPPLPNPRWVRWDHTCDGLWPAIEILDRRDQSAVPPFAVETAVRARRRLLTAELPRVLGHADFEAQNLRWHGQQVYTVHDWDSLAWQPESALVGAASGVFPRPPGVPPSLASIESSEAFLTSYQEARQREFSVQEQQIAWAASLWPAAHNARWQALFSVATPLSGDALRAQAAVRLARANA